MDEVKQYVVNNLSPIVVRLYHRDKASWLCLDTSPNWSDAISVPLLSTLGKICESCLSTKSPACICDRAVLEDRAGISINDGVVLVFFCFLLRCLDFQVL